jgi:hypothetical protein
MEGQVVLVNPSTIGIRAMGVGKVEGPEAGCAAGERSLTLRRIFPTSFLRL